MPNTLPRGPVVSRRTTPARPRRSMVSAIRFLSCIGMLGCGLDSNFADLGERILDPEVQALDAPGELLLRGPHYDLRIAADAEGTRYLLGVSLEQTLSVLNLSTREVCSVAGVEAYGDAVSSPRRSSLIPYLGPAAQAGGPRILRFVDFQCNISPFAGEGLSLNLAPAIDESTPNDSFLGFFALGQGNSLHLIDPWLEATRQLAARLDLRAPERVRTKFAWVDGGQIVIADGRLQEQARVGDGVVNLALPFGAELQLLTIQRRPEGGFDLYRADLENDAVQTTLILSDVCPDTLSYIPLEQGTRLAVMSPCAERRLVLLDPETPAEDPLTVGDGVLGWQFFRRLGGQHALLFTKGQPTQGDVGELWMWREQAGLEQVAASGTLRESMGLDVPGGRRELLVLTDYADGVGRLMHWKADAPLTERASGVARVRYLRDAKDTERALLTALADFNGETGTLLELEERGGARALAEGVPADPTESNAFLSGVSGDLGDLRILDLDSREVATVASRVVRRGFKFTQQFDGIYFLAQSDSESQPELRIQLSNASRSTLIATGVTEAREVAFPAAGIIYGVGEGPDAGAWFAKAL